MGGSPAWEETMRQAHPASLRDGGDRRHLSVTRSPVGEMWACHMNEAAI